MLQTWLSVEKEAATTEEILYVLEGLKMTDVAEGIFNNENRKTASAATWTCPVNFIIATTPHYDFWTFTENFNPNFHE